MNNYSRTQLWMLGSMFVVGVVIGACTAIADWLFSAPEMPRFEALLGFVNPLPAFWLWLTGSLVVGAELLGVGTCWLEKVRKSLAEAYICVWGWFSGLGLFVYVLGYALGQTPAELAAEMLIKLMGMTIAFVGFDLGLHQALEDRQKGRTVRWFFLFVGIAILCALPALARWNAMIS